ncbi:MAG: hypothetical protein R2880_01435 [Deinococcales bacterium]
MYLKHHAWLLALFCALVMLLSACNEDSNPPINPNPNPSSLSFHPKAYGNLISSPQVYNLAAIQQNSVIVNPTITPLVVSPTSAIELKLLVISATADDPGLATVKAWLDQFGTPYDVLIAKDTPLSNNTLLIDADTGRYQGIILVTASLSYDMGGGVYGSAFTAAEWNLLWQYERDLAVRQLAIFTNPTAFPEDYGLRSAAPVVTSGDAPLNVTMTSAGSEIFTSLKTNATLPIKWAYTFPSTLNNSGGVTATPLLQDGSGRILAALSPSADGRERLSLLMGHNPSLLHSQLLGYDLIRWVTKGVFIGERRVYFNIDIDDWYLTSKVWNPATLDDWDFEVKSYRLDAPAVIAAHDRVLALRSRYNIPSLNYNMAFNATAGVANSQANCTASANLSQITLCYGNFFNWISHTYTHAEMDFLDYNTARYELEENIRFGEAHALGFDRRFIVTGKHSGLGWFRIADGQARGLTCVYDQVPNDDYCQFGLNQSNPQMLRAAVDVGIKYMASNRGWLSHTPPCPTCGFYHPLEPRILMIPRWPTNIFYNVTNPTENTSEFNYFYGPNGIMRLPDGSPFFTVDQTWAQIVDFESNLALSHMLNFSAYPHFFHQNNLFEYNPGRSLLFTWIEATLDKYNLYLKLPIVSQNWAQMTQSIEEHTSAFYAKPKATWNRLNNTISLSSSTGGTVFVTGMRFATATESINYAGDTINKLRLNANQSLSGSAITSTTPPPPPNNGELLVNGGFDTNSAWTNCGNASSYSISGSNLNISAGACLFQTVPATPGSNYVLTCNAKADGQSWNTIILSMLDSNWQSITQSFKPNTSAVFQDIFTTLSAPNNAAHVAVSFYSEGNATYSACSLRIGAAPPPPPPPTGNLLTNSSFDSTGGWNNCGNASSYTISGGRLNISAGACLYQTVPASPNIGYKLSCTGNTTGSTWSTFIISALNANWQSISQGFKPLTSSSAQDSVSLLAPVGTAHMAVSFYSEGNAVYDACELVVDSSLQPNALSNGTSLTDDRIHYPLNFIPMIDFRPKGE